MAYSELIKNFQRVRDYMRAFYVYGFKSRDEYTDNVSASEVDRLQYLHITKADFYAKRMQNFLKAHRDAYPELDCCGCGADVKPNLDSAEDCGIFLGGYRAKILR